MLLRQLILRTRSKNPSPPPMHQITHILHNTLDILSHQLTSRLTKQNINFLQRFVLSFRHEQQLIEPSQYGDAAIKAEREANARHGGLHVGEEVGDEPGAEEEGYV